MEKNSENNLVIDFLEYYFKTPKDKYQKSEISYHKVLIDKGVLYENHTNNDILEINYSSNNLLEAILKIAEIKTNKQLPLDLSEAFKFLNDFEKNFKEENKHINYNSYDLITKKLNSFVLSILYKKGINIKDFLLSLKYKNRESYLYNFESVFFDFLPTSEYSIKEIFEIFDNLNINIKNIEYKVVDFFRSSFKQDFNFGKGLLNYALENNINERFISDLLIGAYNSGDLTALDKTINLKDKNFSKCLYVLGRLDYRSYIDLEKSFNQIGKLEFTNIEIASFQSWLIRNIILNEYSTDNIRNNSFKLFADFLINGNDTIKKNVFNDIILIHGFEGEKYNLLLIYLSNKGKSNVIINFFNNFKDPVYVFDFMIKLFKDNPNYNFPTEIFKYGIINAWKLNQEKTEQQILNLFKYHPVFVILAVNIIFCNSINILNINLLLLDKPEYQINAINSICNYPHSFDKLLSLILPLRNSKLEGVREHLQNKLSQKVFSSHQDIIYNQIKNSISKNSEDKIFLEPIKKVLKKYHKMKTKKESISDLNPYENESYLMDLYNSLESEQLEKEMNKVRQGKGTIFEMAKNYIIVRGNSFKLNDKPQIPLSKIESIVLIDRNFILNPDLYELNLNKLE